MIYILGIHETEKTMSLQIGDIAPDFEANTTDGHLKFHDYIDGSWVVFFSHPKDFTFLSGPMMNTLRTVALSAAVRPLALPEALGWIMP